MLSVVFLAAGCSAVVAPDAPRRRHDPRRRSANDGKLACVVHYVHRDEVLAITALENVLVVAWLGNPTIAAVQALERASLVLARAAPLGIGHLNVVARTGTPSALDEPTRTRLIALLRDPAQQLVATATVYGDGGFISAAIRGVLSGLSLVSGGKAKVRFVPDIPAADTWIRATLLAAGASSPSAGALTSLATSVLVDLERDGASFKAAR